MRQFISNRAAIALTSIGLAIYIFCIMYPLSQIRTYLDSITSSQQSTRYQLAAIIAYAICTVLGYLLIRKNRVSLDLKWIILFILFSLWCLISTFWSISAQRTLLYAALFVFFTLSNILFWNMGSNYISRSSFISAIVLVAMTLFLFSVLQIRDRTLGWITPNLLGHYGLALIVLSLLSRYRFRIIFILAGFSLIVFSEARTVFLSASAYLVILYSFNSFLSNRRTLSFGLVTGFMACLLLLFFIFPLVGVLQNLVSQSLGVQEYNRLEGSGFTGRVEYWRNGYEVLKERFWIGYGFRSRSGLALDNNPASGAHSGILNSALDIGVIGSILFIGLYIYSTIKLSINAANPLSCKISYYGFVFLVSYIPILLIEPNYLNFAHPTSFLLCLFISLGALKTGVPRT